MLSRASLVPGIWYTHVLGSKIPPGLAVRLLLRKITGALRVGRYHSLNIDRVLLTALFEIREEEGLVLYDRSAYREPVLIAKVIGFGTAVEIVARIKRRALPDTTIRCRETSSIPASSPC